MKVFNEYYTRIIESKCTLFFICVLVISSIFTSCHRKVGVKPGERLEKVNKCKCKTDKGGLYGIHNTHKPSIFFYDYSFIAEVKV